MATNENLDDSAWMDEFLTELGDAPDDQFPDWIDADDLGRLHLQSFATTASDYLELNQSRGMLRLTGTGVRGHALNLDDAGLVLTNFQRLVTSAGAACRGVKTSRGRIARDITERTQLALTASPGRGSVTLEFEPVMREAEERYPKGKIPLINQNIPLVEESLDITFDVLSAAAQLDGRRDVVDELFSRLGVRVASAALALTEGAASSALDLNLTWQKPGVAGRRLKVSAAQSATFSLVLRGRGLDSDTDKFSGVLRTISDRRKIDLETADPENPEEVIVLPIEKGDVDLRPYRLGQAVEITVRTRITQRPGGSEQRTYTAAFITASDQDPHDD